MTIFRVCVQDKLQFLAKSRASHFLHTITITLAFIHYTGQPDRTPDKAPTYARTAPWLRIGSGNVRAGQCSV